jgi:hypothetical protein
METLTQTQQTQIFEFLNNLNTEICITDYVNIEDIDFNDAFNSIIDTLSENEAFNIDIIYYSNAIDYLQKNDASLRESINIAIELGYELQNVNSELLASLLVSQNVQNDFYSLETEITNFFNELL